MGEVGRESRFAGCLLGGAVGDALGAAVEFMPLAAIRRQFGPAGIAEYAPAYGRRGAITDDTQMTLFTAEGLIRAFLRSDTRGVCSPIGVVHHAYVRWLATQGESSEAFAGSGEHDGWLYRQRGLHARRAPGNTCLSALRGDGSALRAGNDSKGCGGVMRVAPVGLVADRPFQMGCEVAAITHGHPTGYLAAGFLAHVIGELVRGADLPAAIRSAGQELAQQPSHEECAAAVARAVEAADGEPTAEAVEKLGQGWIAEEALGISLYCALQARDFAHGVTLAANHSGDSDSTGAITGNLLGAWWGREAIPARFLADLELREVVEQVAADLARIVGNGDYQEEDLERYPPW